MIFNDRIQIDQFVVSKVSPTFIIAEAGVNHGGDVKVAKKLVDIAKRAGADAVKFQAFKPENLILSNVAKAPYQANTTDASESQMEMLKKLQLRKNHYIEIKDYCDKIGICFLITPFDEESLEELEELGVSAYKIASTDTTNIPFLKKIASKNKPIILSTGMSYMEEVELAMTEIGRINKNVILLQCTANYPIKDNEANLNVIRTFIKKFKCIVGYSDHSVSLGASPYAVALGAKVIEKHFTIDKKLEGPDHRASLSPEELNVLVKEIRRVEAFVSDSGAKKPTFSESLTRKKLQKCLVASEMIEQEEEFNRNNIVAKRTGGHGISPIYFEDVIGRKAPKNFNKNEIIFIK